MKPSERTLRGLKKQWYLAGRRLHCRQHTSEPSNAACEGQVLPRSMGMPRVGARLPESLSEATQELLFLSRRGKVEAWKHRPEPPALEPGELSER